MILNRRPFFDKWDKVAEMVGNDFKLPTWGEIVCDDHRFARRPEQWRSSQASKVSTYKDFQAALDQRETVIPKL